MVSRRTMLAATAGVAAGMSTAACARGSTAKWAAAGSEQPLNDQPKAAPTSTARVTVTPAADAVDVSPKDQITISADGGTLQTVTVLVGDKPVDGTLDADQRTWRSSGHLEYAKTYSVAVSAVDPTGLAVQHASSFTTIKPSATATTTFQANALLAIKNGGTYGVGQPVIVRFSKAVKDRTAALQAVEVVTSPSVQGRWRWFDSQTAHWRPASYWASGTKITVRANLFGVHLGNGVYGAANTSTQFSIGPSRIAIADYKTKYMQVFINGAMVRNIPVSLGKGGSAKTSDGKTVNYWTYNGPHVLLNKERSVRMTSASYGITDPKDKNYYDEVIKLCCRISYSGEYVHLADWNIPQQGRVNTSHGCINVGPANAQWFYDTFGIGDVVEVKNSPKPLASTNGIGDWTIPWSQW